MNKEEKEAFEYFLDDIEFLKDDLKNPNFLGKYITIRSKEVKMLEDLLNLIQKQDKIIDKMAEFLEDELTIDEFCNKENCYADEYINGHCQKCLNCIKEYFKKEVEKDVKD